jgi:hypothetical protein
MLDRQITPDNIEIAKCHRKKMKQTAEVCLKSFDIFVEEFDIDGMY